MVTEEEYLKALDTVKTYERQNSKTIHDFLDAGGEDISVRLFNILHSQMHKFKDINLITKLDFYKIKGAGASTWNEFVKLRGF